MLASYFPSGSIVITDEIGGHSTKHTVHQKFWISVASCNIALAISGIQVLPFSGKFVSTPQFVYEIPLIPFVHFF